MPDDEALSFGGGHIGMLTAHRAGLLVAAQGGGLSAAGGRTAGQVADTVQEKLQAHGYTEFARTDASLAGQAGVMLDFAAQDADGRVTRRIREYFAVRGQAAFVLGMGSTTWPEHLPLIEQIAGRFELVP